LKDPYGDNEDKDMIAREFVRLIQIMFSNKGIYMDVLTKYGFLEEEYFRQSVYMSQSSLIYTKKKSSISDIINRFD
jgi:endo-alpha-1,4-polygalactosaminidase (GH114 family)